MQAYTESVAISRRLAAADPGDVDLRDDIALGLNNLGRTQLMAGNLDGARASFEESVALVRELAGFDPDSATLQGRQFLTISSLGQARLMLGDRDGARQAFEEATRVSRALSARDPKNVDWRISLAGCLFFLQSAVDDVGRRREILQEAAGIFAEVGSSSGLAPEMQMVAGAVRQTLAGLGPAPDPGQ
jgi:hypothetical protein